MRIEAHAQAIVIPAHHPVYDWLRNQRVLGKIPDYQHENLPHHRTDVNQWLRKVLEHASTSAHDKAIARDFLSEFDVNYSRPAFKTARSKSVYNAAKDIIKERPEPYIYGGISADSNFSGAIYLQRFWGSIARIDDGRLGGYVEHPGVGVKIFSSFYNRIGLFFQADNPSFLGDSIRLIRFVPQWNSTHSYNFGITNSYKYETYLSFQAPYVSVILGRGALSMGAAVTEPLVVRPDAPWFSWLNTRFGSHRIHFYNTYGYLHAGSTFSTIPYNGSEITVRRRPPRWIYVHGLRAQPASWLSISVFETLIYARGFDLDYANPMVPYLFSEQDKGDMDDKKLGAEVIVRPVKRLELFGSILIDDLVGLNQIAKLDSTKMIFTVGANAMLPFDIQSGVSYTRSDANMYTHYMRLNTYENKGQSIGFGLGPNAEEYAFRISRWFPFRTRLRFSAALQRKGLNPVNAQGVTTRNVGGDLLRGFLGTQRLYDGADVHEWLVRDIEVITEPVRGAYFSYRITKRTVRSGTRIAPITYAQLIFRVGI
jgi:hypothetical protein